MATRKPRKRKQRKNDLPKGAYRLPDGNYVTTGPWGQPDKKGRRIRVTAVHRAEPDVRLLARALLEVAKQEHAKRSDSR